MAITDENLIHKDLASKLSAPPDRIRALAAEIYEKGWYKRGDFEKVEYSAADLASIAPKLFAMPTLPPNASDRQKAEVATRLAGFIEGSISLPYAPAYREPSVDEAKVLAAEDLEKRVVERMAIRDAAVAEALKANPRDHHAAMLAGRAAIEEEKRNEAKAKLTAEFATAKDKAIADWDAASKAFAERQKALEVKQ